MPALLVIAFITIVSAWAVSYSPPAILTRIVCWAEWFAYNDSAVVRDSPVACLSFYLSLSFSRRLSLFLSLALSISLFRSFSLSLCTSQSTSLLQLVARLWENEWERVERMSARERMSERQYNKETGDWRVTAKAETLYSNHSTQHTITSLLQLHTWYPPPTTSCQEPSCVWSRS